MKIAFFAVLLGLLFSVCGAEPVVKLGNEVLAAAVSRNSRASALGSSRIPPG